MNSARAIGLVVSLGVLAFCSWKVNQKPRKPEAKPAAPRVVDLEARKVLQKADAATRAAKIVQYNATYAIKGAGRHTMGVVRMDDTKGRLSVTATRVERYATENDKYETATDGETMYHISHLDKKYMHGPFVDRVFLPPPGQELIMRELGYHAPFGDELKCDSTYEGQEAVGDVLCDVVYVKYERYGDYARWYIGPDGLPRKVERLSGVYPG